MDMFFSRKVAPYEKTWEQRAALWCRWLLSIQKQHNPALDNDGHNSAKDQNDPDVWFLAGSFGNETTVNRTCFIPNGSAIFFPIIVKECSFAEDTDLRTEDELITRSSNDMDYVTRTELTLDGTCVHDFNQFRLQSETFKLDFPKDNVYDVEPQSTISTCNGYWVFLKPLRPGMHHLIFLAEALLPEGYVVTTDIKRLGVYKPIHEYVKANSSMKIEVAYKIIVREGYVEQER
jgi:hypothetical protein